MAAPKIPRPASPNTNTKYSTTQHITATMAITAAVMQFFPNFGYIKRLSFKQKNV